MSIKKLGAAIAVGIFCSAALFGGNAFAADTYSIQLEDADFYNALKICGEQGLSEDDFAGPGEPESINQLYCDIEYSGATFDDATMSLVFEDEAAANNFEWISLPNMGLKHIKDLAKFPGFTYGNFAHNALEDADEIDDIMTVLDLEVGSIVIADNNLTGIPRAFKDYVENEDFNDELPHSIMVYSMLASSQNLTDTYNGNTYTLPAIIPDVVDGFDNLADLLDGMIPAGASDDDIARMQYFIDFFDKANWLSLENATLSDDGTTLTAIDPNKDMTIAYRRNWTEIETMLKTTFGCTQDGECTADEIAARDAAVASLLAMFHAYHDDDEWASVVTIKIAPANPESPDTFDGAATYGLIALAATITTLGGIAIAAKSRR